MKLKSLFLFLISFISISFFNPGFTQKSITDIAFINTGIWIPTKNISPLGDHPYFGVGIGKNISNKLNLYFLANYRFLKAKNTYDYQFKGSTFNDDYYTGMIFGFELDYLFFKQNNFSLELISSLGYDRFDFRKPEGNWFEKDFNKEGAVHSPAVTLGLSGEQMLNNQFALALFCKYNLVDYTIQRKTTLSGNTIELGARLKFLEAHFKKSEK